MAPRHRNETDGNDTLLDRRSYLKLAGAAALGSAVLRNITSQARAAPPTDQFSNVVNVVKAGADPNGNGDISGVVKKHANDDTLLLFPDGTYKMRDVSLSGLTNFGMAAADGAKPMIVPSGPRSSLGEVYLQFSGGSDWLLQGIDFDFTKSGYGGRIQILSGGDFTMRDVECHGVYPNETKGARFDVRNPNGKALVERFIARGGTRDNDDVTGIFVGKEHSGEIVIRNCVMEGFSNNGIYASAPGLSSGGNGPVKVEGGLYRNNNVANVRIGSEGSYIKGVTVIVDEKAPLIHGALNSRGLRVRDRQDQVIEDCDVIMEAGSGSGAVVLHHEAGRVYVRNTRIKVSTGGYNAIMAKTPSGGGNVGPVFENVSITGNSAAPDAAVVKGRDNTQFENCCIQMSGGGQDGVVLSNCDGSSVTDSTINVPGRAVVLSGSSADTSNISHSGTCPVPDAKPGQADGSGSGGSDGSSGSGGSGGSDGSSGSTTTTTSDGSGSSGGSGGSDQLPNSLSISGGSPSTSVNYQFSVDGELKKSYDNGASIDSEDSVDGGDATGTVAGGTDSYRYSGKITAFGIDGDAKLYRNGSSVTPADLDPSGDGQTAPAGSGDSGGSSGDGSQLSNLLTIAGGSPSNVAHYQLSVTGGLEHSTANGASIDSEDSITDGTAKGAVAGGADSYEFGGDLSAFTMDGDATVYLNGTQVDPASLGSTPKLENVLSVVGSGSKATYAFAVSGGLKKSTDRNASINDGDTVSGSTAKGAVAGGTDSYRFSGDVSAFTMDGDATVYLNGTQVDPASLGGTTLPNSIVVDGTGGAGSSSYSFEVTGDVQKDRAAGSVESADAIDGSSVSGSVAGDVDAYRFSGDVVSFNVVGTAAVNFEDTDG